MVLLDLVVTWGRIGAVGFGGGPAMIPLMKAECVDGRGWWTEEQFLDAVAAGSALPGPISTKMAVASGLHEAGIVGAAIALASVVAPSALLMGALMAVLVKLRDHPAGQGALAAVKPAAIALLAWTVVDLAPGALRGGLRAGLVVAGAFVALALKVHPALVLVAAMLVGAFLFR